MNPEAWPSYADRRIEEILRDGCDHCGGEVEIIDVPVGPHGLYAEVACLKGGSRVCAEMIQRVSL